MENILTTYNTFLWVMAAVAVVVFVALQFFEAGYGYLFDRRYGPPVNNKVGWVLMESPVFVAMCILWAMSDRQWATVPLVLFSMFQLHYFQRSFIFPFILKGKSKMPIIIMLMGAAFCAINGFIQGEWIFFLAPKTMYTVEWLTTPQFIIGVILFFGGMIINLHSDHVIRHLRKPGDTKHYLPKKGFYKYVTSANYFGEIVEWIGFAIASWSWAGVLFVVWTCANLVPRSNSIYKRYKKEFSEEFDEKRLKRVFPFVY